MKISSIMQKFKSLSKKAKICLCICLVVFLLILVFVLKGLLGGGSTSFYTIFDKTFSTKIGNYKYVIEVTSKEHSSTSKNTQENVTKEDLEKVEADVETETEDDSSEGAEVKDEGLDSAKHSDSITSEWGNSKGSTKVDWTYPNYKIVVTGRTESVDPLRGTINVEIATPYVNNKLFSATVVDGKYYIDLGSLRNWLLTATDEKLVNLASNIPENAVYLTMNENELHFYSIFAEDNEYEVSGTYDVDELYNRFIVLEKTISSVMKNNLGKTGLTKNQDKYGLVISGDDSIKVYSLLKSNLNSISSSYSSYVKNLQKNGLMTDSQASQAVKERDNFLEYVSDRWVWLNSASTDDFKNRNLVIQGVADTFENDNGETTYEVNCSLSFTDTEKNIDYVFTLAGEKSPLSASSETVSIPTGSTCTMDELGKTANLKFVVTSLVDYFDPLNVFEEVKIDKTSELVVSDMIDSFIELVNKTNLGVADFTPITRDTVVDFIKKYSEMKSSDNELDKVNARLTQELLTSLDKVTGSSVVVETVQQEAEVEQFREVTADIVLGEVTIEESNEVTEDISSEESIGEDGTVLEEVESVSTRVSTGTARIIANINEEESNIHLAVIDAVLLNTCDVPITVNLDGLSLKNIMSNKYPCNYEPILHEYDNGFDMTLAPSTVDIPVGGYVEVKLYSVIDNGWEYFDLFYGDTKLGDIVAY